MSTSAPPTCTYSCEPPRYRWHLGCILLKDTSDIVADRQQGRVLYDRFSREEAAALWEAYRHVDDAMQSQLTSPPCPEPHQGLNWEAGFQGGPTAYSFYELPTGVVHPCAEPATPLRAMRLTALGLAWAERAVAPRGTCHGWEGVRGARRGSRRLHVA